MLSLAVSSAEVAVGRAKGHRSVTGEEVTRRKGPAFIEEKNRRLGNNGSSNRDPGHRKRGKLEERQSRRCSAGPLLLAAGKKHSAFADPAGVKVLSSQEVNCASRVHDEILHGIVTLGKSGNEAVRISLLRRGDDPCSTFSWPFALERGSYEAMFDVAGDGSSKERGLLRH